MYSSRSLWFYLHLLTTQEEFPGGSVIKNLSANAGDTGDLVRSLGWENPLEKKVAKNSNILAWRIPWTEEPGGLVCGVAKSMGLQLDATAMTVTWEAEHLFICLFAFHMLFFFGEVSA